MTKRVVLLLHIMLIVPLADFRNLVVCGSLNFPGDTKTFCNAVRFLKCLLGVPLLIELCGI